MSAAKCNTEGALESLSSVQRAAGGREEGRERRLPGELKLRKRDANLDANYKGRISWTHVVGSMGQTTINIQLFCT